MGQQTPIRLAYGNLVTPLVTITANSAAAQFPDDYLAVEWRDVRWRSTVLTGVTVRVRFASPLTFNCLALRDHNLTADGTVEVHGSSDAWVSDDQLLLPASPAGNDPHLFYIDSQEYQDVEFRFEDAANPDGYIEVGRLFVGNYVQPQYNYLYGWTNSAESTSEITEALNKVRHGNRKPQRKIPQFAFLSSVRADKEMIDALAAEVDTTDPFYLAVDPDNHSEETHCVTLTALPTVKRVGFTRWDYPLSTKEWV